MSIDTWLVLLILIAIIVEIILEWRWHKEIMSHKKKKKLDKEHK